MFRVTQLSSMSDQKLDRIIRRLALVLVVGTVAFLGYYFLDRHPAAGPTLVDRQIAQAEEAVRAQPENVDERMALAGLYVNAKRYDEAQKQYAEVLTVKPDSTLAMLGRGAALYLAEDLSSAEGMYQQIVDVTKSGEFTKVDPTVEEAHFYLATIAAKTGRSDRAIAEYTSALKIEPTDADALYGLGMAYLAEAKPADAIKPLRDAVAFVPLEWGDPYTALKDAYTRLGKRAEAAWADAMFDLTQKQYDAGTAKLQALTGPGASADVYLGLGFAAEAVGDSAKAAAWYRSALDVDPESFNAIQGLGRTDPSSLPSQTPDAHASPAPASAAPATPAPSMKPLPRPGDHAGVAMAPGAAR